MSDSHTDTPENGQTDETLQQAHRTLQALVQASPVGIIALDLDEKVAMWNPAAEQIFGRSKQEVLNRPLSFVLQEKQEEFRALHKRVLQGEACAGVEIRGQKKDGTTIDLSLSTAPLRDATDEIIGVMGVVTDITEHKRADEALQAKTRDLAIKTERLEVLAMLSRTVTSTLDPQEVFNLIVDAVVRLLDAALSRVWVVDQFSGDLVRKAGAGDSDLIDCPQLRLRPGEDMAGEALVEKETISINHPARDPRHLQTKWAQDKGIKAAAAVPLALGDRVLGVLSAKRRVDIPFSAEDLRLLALFASQAAIAVENARLYERNRQAARHLEAKVATRTQELEEANVRLQEALRRAEEASRIKSRFLATMSHELRTPLNAIIGFSELLEDCQFGSLNARQKRYVSHVLASGRHLLSLINDILDLTKIEADKLKLHPASFPLSKALEASLQSFYPQAEEKGLELQLGLKECPPTLVADPVRFKQIIWNLLSNAVKFTPSGGTVTVSARVRRPRSEVRGYPEGPDQVPTDFPTSDIGHPTSDYGDIVEITVEDTGIGFKVEDVPKLFQEFTQLDASLARRHEGTGLGLALTKKLVEMHGGTIQADSAGEGRGSTFTVILPLDGSNPATPLP